jgi:3-deoxy-manno-octulosonate cytidylyltransferase (CMP-KDO synthetase)
VLQQIAQLKQSSLEKLESLEQLRWLENNYSIGIEITNLETVGIDTKEDLKKALSKPNTNEK